MGEQCIAVDCPTEALAKIILGLKPGEEIRYAGDGSTLKAMGKATAPNLPPDKGCWGVRITRADRNDIKFFIKVSLKNCSAHFSFLNIQIQRCKIKIVIINLQVHLHLTKDLLTELQVLILYFLG